MPLLTILKQSNLFIAGLFPVYYRDDKAIFLAHVNKHLQDRCVSMTLFVH